MLIANNCRVIYNQTGYQYVFDLAGSKWQTHLFETPEEAVESGMKLIQKKMDEYNGLENA